MTADAARSFDRFRTGCRRCLPLGAGVAAYGLVFGVLAKQVGLATLDVATMSALVFTGSAQFVALTLWGAAPPALAIGIATLVVNLRYVLMAAALRDVFEGSRRAAAFAAVFLMCDESWALTIGDAARGSGAVAFLAGSGCVVYVAWVASTIVGCWAGDAIGEPARWGIDFAFTAAFLGLLLGLWRGRRDIAPWMVAAVVATSAALCIPGKWYILLGGIAGATTGSLRRAA